MNYPKHLAIIMDGNGRWAKKRHLPRVAGHQQALETIRNIITFCAQKNIPVLTLYAFSSENWRRPKSEVDFLFSLFLRILRQEVQSLHDNGICLKVIGDRAPFSGEFQEAILEAEQKTAQNTKLRLNVMLNYGARWDILQAVQKVAQEVHHTILSPAQLTESVFQSYLALPAFPEPDLLIRTGGEERISNFLLWHLAYTELYFTQTLWPDFKEAELEKALISYAKRERRYGQTSEQVEILGTLESLHA